MKNKGGIIEKEFPEHGNGTADGRTGLKFHDVRPGSDPFCRPTVKDMLYAGDKIKEGAKSSK